MKRDRAGMGGLIGRAASLAVALIAVLTLVVGGASHELLHADERGGPEIQASAGSQTIDDKTPARDASHKQIPVHGCSGHCAAHVADQAPVLTLLPAPLEQQASWRIEASAALRQLPTAGPERPPRA